MHLRVVLPMVLPASLLASCSSSVDFEEVEIEGYVEWRRDGVLIADGQRVRCR